MKETIAHQTRPELTVWFGGIPGIFAGVHHTECQVRWNATTGYSVTHEFTEFVSYAADLDEAIAIAQAVPTAA